MILYATARFGLFIGWSVILIIILRAKQRVHTRWGGGQVRTRGSAAAAAIPTMHCVRQVHYPTAAGTRRQLRMCTYAQR